MIRKRIFISHSHKDEKLFKELLVHLKPWLDRQVLDVWTDKDINAGQKWHKEIQEAVRSTAVAVLLISPNFMASDYIQQHELPPFLKAAEERQLSLVCLYLRPSQVADDDYAFMVELDSGESRRVKLSDYQGLNKPNETLAGMPIWRRDELFAKAVVQIRELYKNYVQLDYYLSTRIVQHPLNEAKLILVGRGGVGKTSLVNRLVHKTFNEGENKTEGIQITHWTVHIGQDDIRLNIWDFSGQEIMHATHQFFLTERSLYLLVLNGREGFQDYDVEYWLKLIESFGRESPIIIILNKIKQCPFELNYRVLQAKYPQIRAFVKTNCDPETGINELCKEIFNVINQLRDVRAKFPASWFSIKDRLSGMQENYLSLDRYRDLCRQQGEQDEKAQDDLAGFLHCLGIALHYRDDPRLRDTSILNPHWVTNGIYRLLDAERLAENKGILQAERSARTAAGNRLSSGKA